MDGIDRYSDTGSESSIPEVLTRDQIREFDDGNLLHSRNGPEQLSVNQRFSEMNKQITELTNLVLMLPEKISSSNREGNDLNTVSIGHETRSDMVTGATTSNTQTNPQRQSTSQYPQSSTNQMEDIVTEIHHLRDTMSDNLQHPKIL